jgi:hypothetical protein
LSRYKIPACLRTLIAKLIMMKLLQTGPSAKLRFYFCYQH